MKQLHQNQEFRFNEILFEHRNKEYGAYVLRNESDRILTKALFIGVGLLAAVSVTPFIISAFKTVDVPITGTIYHLPPPVDVDQPEAPPIEPVKPIQPVSPPNTKEFNSELPTPSKEAREPLKVEKPDDAIPGLTNNPTGDPIENNTHIPIHSTMGNGPVAPPRIGPATTSTIPDNTVFGPDGLSVEASFMGGIDVFRNKVMNNFDGSGFESDDLMRTTITFIVEVDGTISAIKANGVDSGFNNEAIRTIKSIKGKWTPGKNKQGQPVRSYFKFPISMKFDN
ncbi:energy transducer TonB [Chryseobacterium potabilaquae]|uniref:Protein TonB n=1 Tax=Chryseobacterium potabilaquae TaxID=2675057 RepID=A0A6N4X6Z2_9FLAO|nr:energy transducer TonB [Chryseobacterium potabilaquae]CAA7194670.1 hypothetical protein CHRY9293_00958 [Chryseobacterium potabilaquae]